jgi:iron complex transport system ATP-binding protein
MIRIRDFSFSYGPQAVLSQVSLDIREKALTILLGRNGSGKSTLLRCVAGLLPYHSGSITIDGAEVNRLAAARRAALIGFLGQHHRPVFPFRVMDVVLTGRAGQVRFRPSPADQAAAVEALDTIGIIHLSERPYTNLSGGEQQLVMIARALAQKPRVLLLDEPTSHLDYRNQIGLLRLLRRLVAEGMTVVVVMHDPNLAFLFGDDFFFVHNRCVNDSGALPPWQSPLLERIYFEPLARLPFGTRGLIMPRWEDV